MILDAIDILEGKVTLIAEALKRGVTLYLSMGAARRQDPTQVRAGRLGRSRDVRWPGICVGGLKELGIEEKVYSGLECVYSREKAQPSLSEQSENLGVEYGMGDTGAKAPLPSSIAVDGCIRIVPWESCDSEDITNPRGRRGNARGVRISWRGFLPEPGCRKIPFCSGRRR